jgi:hypothetical protein
MFRKIAPTDGGPVNLRDLDRMTREVTAAGKTTVAPPLELVTYGAAKHIRLNEQQLADSSAFDDFFPVFNANLTQDAPPYAVMQVTGWDGTNVNADQPSLDNLDPFMCVVADKRGIPKRTIGRGTNKWPQYAAITGTGGGIGDNLGTQAMTWGLVAGRGWRQWGVKGGPIAGACYVNIGGCDWPANPDGTSCATGCTQDIIEVQCVTVDGTPTTQYRRTRIYYGWQTKVCSGDWTTDNPPSSF